MAQDKNPTNSSVIQLLLDMEKFGFDTVTMRQELARDPKRLREVEDYFESHLYPDKSIAWTRLTKYEGFRALLELSDAALRIMILMIQIAPQSSLVSLSVRGIGNQFHMSNSTVQNGIAELVEHGFIAVVRPGSGRRAPIWMIHPDLAISGKPIRENAAYKELIDTYMQGDKHPENHPLALLTEMQDIHSNVGVAIITDRLADGSIIKYSTLSITADKEESAAAAKEKELPSAPLPDNSDDCLGLDIPNSVDDSSLPFNQ